MSIVQEKLLTDMSVDKTYSSPSEGPYRSYFARQFNIQFGKCFVILTKIEHLKGSKIFYSKRGYNSI